MNKTILCLVLGGSMVLGGCGKKEDSKPKAAGENPVTAPADYVGAVGQAQKAAVKTLGTASLDQAIKMFQAEKGRFPNSLDELVSSGTLPKLPDPPNGMKFDYDPATGRVKVVAK